MKTNFFKMYKRQTTARVAPICLLLLLTGTATLLAQNGVTVSGLEVNAGTVTFNVSWSQQAMQDLTPPLTLWSDSVWVFVDYNKAGVMERLPLSAGATLTKTSAPGVGKVKEEPGNNKGVWVIGNARTNGSFSATVQLLTATAAADFSGACVYGSNYPPVGEYTSDTEISFTGTPMYDLVLEHDGSTVTVQSGNTLLLPCDYTLQSFTDKTGAPGIMKCIPMTGDIDFIVPVGSKNTQVSFVVSSEPVVPDPASITYLWSAPDLSPATQEGHTFTATMPTTAGTYPVTLIAQSSGYCSVVKTKEVTVIDCHAPGSTVNFTAFNPCSVAATGATWTLQDTRESGNNQNYKVKKMPDGHIWMVQDMKFGACSVTGTWYNDNSAAATTHTPTVASGYVGHCSAATNSSTPSNRGYLYNWPAAMNNSNACYSSTVTSFQCTGTATGTSGPNPGACQGICPEGWHIPTGNTAGEFQALHTAIGGCATNNDNCWDAASAWEGVLGGSCRSDGSLYPQGSDGTYWSSTYVSSGNAYSLYFTSTYTYPGTGDTNKLDGRTVRCVRNY